MRREPGDVELILPFEEVVEALGRTGERDLGTKVIDLDSIVGTVDRRRDFDRSFRPLSPNVRGRWERMAAAMRRGEAFPPISVYRVGDVHFVRDGHHRVSVARSLRREDIEARVVEVSTRVGATREIRVGDLPLKDHERLFWERVPLPRSARQELMLSDPWGYGRLAEGIEAWGCRVMHAREEHVPRADVARLWLKDEYRPVVRMLRDAGMIGAGTETDAYLRVGRERYRLLRTHEWSDEIVEQLRRAGA